MADSSNWHAVVGGGTTTPTPTLTNNNTTNNLVDFSPQFSSFAFGVIDSNPFQPPQLPIYPSPSIPVTNPFPNQPPPPPQPMQTPIMNSQANSSTALPPFHPRTLRYRRKRNQPTRMVLEMTQEELMDDTWTWRKYGQKPIKGSPHPRCSASKGCGARKHVERNIYNPTTFMVSYHGQHTHSRPVHRSSLVVLNNGQNQFFNTHKAILDTSASNAMLPASTMFIPPGYSTPMVSNPGLIPTSSSMEVANVQTQTQTQTQAQAQAQGQTDQQEIIVIEDDDEEMVNAEDDDDDDDILIPNLVMAEDILSAFEELRGGK